mmetsp:Transcript_1655/g.6508  ORF Transcript_1655/g.6508 Transcript_1655/m.6508 type:complete len:210 (+) Transcript_1655:926-1555(+)
MGSSVPRPNIEASALQRRTLASTFGPKPFMTLYPSPPFFPAELNKAISTLSGPSRSRKHNAKSNAASTRRFCAVAASAFEAWNSFWILSERDCTVMPSACVVFRQRKAQPISLRTRAQAMTALLSPVRRKAQISWEPSKESPARPSSLSDIAASANSLNFCWLKALTVNAKKNAFSGNASRSTVITSSAPCGADVMSPECLMPCHSKEL